MRKEESVRFNCRAKQLAALQADVVSLVFRTKQALMIADTGELEILREDAEHELDGLRS